MIINYQGKSYFKLQSGEKIILIDPTDQRSFKNARIVLSTFYPSFEVDEKSRNPFFITSPGEYDIDDIKIYGKLIAYENNVEKIAYNVFFDEIYFGILPLIKKVPEMKNLELLEDIDILLIQSNASGYLTSEEIAKIIRQLEPGLVIPYFIENSNPSGLLKELNQENVLPEEKITIKKKEIVPNKMALRWIRAE